MLKPIEKDFKKKQMADIAEVMSRNVATFESEIPARRAIELTHEVLDELAKSGRNAVMMADKMACGSSILHEVLNSLHASTSKASGEDNE